MTAGITPDRGGWPAFPGSSSQVAGDIGRSTDGSVPPAGGPQPETESSAPVHGGARHGSGTQMAPRFVAEAPAKAAISSAHRNATSESTAAARIRLRRANARDKGAAVSRAQASNGDAPHAETVSGPTVKALAEEGVARKKLTAKIHLRAGQPRNSSMHGVSTSADALACRAMPPLTEGCAIKVAQHIQGRRGKIASAYLARLAEQQAQRGEAELTQLVEMLIHSAPRPETSGPRPGAGATPVPEAMRGIARVPDQVLGAARQATEAWLLSGYLHRDGQATDGHGEPALIDGLEDNVNRVLHRLGSQALLALHGRLVAEDALTAPPRTGMFSRQMEATVDAVGLLAVRDAWAASAICDQVGHPLGFNQLCRILRDATAVTGAKADVTSMMNVIKNLAPLAMDRFQYLLVQFLRIRTAEILRGKGISINELIGIARTDVPRQDYAANVADALRSTFGAGALSMDDGAARHPSDDKLRLRLGTLLSQFSDPELRVAAANLSIGAVDFVEQAQSMKRRVEGCGADSAGRAALGRQFTVLCAMVADEFSLRFAGQAAPLVLDKLREWEWDDRFSRDTQIPPSPTRFERAARAASRGFRRLFFSVFHSYKEDQRRLRDAYAAVVQSASRFVGAVAANIPPDREAQAWNTAQDLDGIAGARAGPATTGSARPTELRDALRAFDKSGARLMRAIQRCQVISGTPGGDIARTHLQIPADPARLLDAAFRDALGSTPGGHVNALGRVLSSRQWLNGLLVQHNETRANHRTDTRQMLDRLSAYIKDAWRPSIGHADAQYLMKHLQATVKEEAGIRAATEIFHTLGRHFADERTHDASAASPTDGTSPAARLLTDIRALEQRFRPLDNACFPQVMSSRMDWQQLLGMGLKRLPRTEQDQLRDAICDLDRPRPPGLAQDELWLASVRCFQDRGRLV